MNLFIIGFKASGKTAVGKALAKKLDACFLDLDDVIEDLYLAETGGRLACRDIYNLRGGDFFRALERRAVELLAKKKDSVIALGGGTVVYQNNAALLKKCGKFIYLRESHDAMLKRIAEKGVPAFLDPNDLKGSMLRELEKRKPYYEKYADLSVDISGLSIGQIAEKIFGLLGGKGAFRCKA